MSSSRDPIRALVMFVAATGCGDSRQAPPPAVVIAPDAPPGPPLPAGTRIACEQLLDPEPFTRALGTKQPLVVRDDTAQATGVTARCSLLLGSIPLTADEREFVLNLHGGHIEVLPGEPVCEVTVACSALEDVEQRCVTGGGRYDRSLGTYACRQIVAGADGYRFLDEDTRCVLDVRGPEVAGHDSTRRCAITARDTIGPPQIK